MIKGGGRDQTSVLSDIVDLDLLGSEGVYFVRDGYVMLKV